MNFSTSRMSELRDGDKMYEDEFTDLSQRALDNYVDICTQFASELFDISVQKVTTYMFEIGLTLLLKVYNENS